MFTATHEITAGTETIHGTVIRTSDTAALISTDQGPKWFPFYGTNGLITTTKVEPLVRLI